MAYKDDEIKQLLREERSRGKRRPPPLKEQIEKRLLELRIVEELLKERNISLFLKALNAIGLCKGSDDYNLALEAWHDHWRRR